ncbi:MAG: hypothetical protein COY38_00920 [Candidatus Aenigmarchaeota archaeon CG_4_10_14_0_8_um_filter_37_24]|nr:MAG: hypothetical protein AUJ50_02970 [Candidatus Aenigmarchaeota archaeon CG1_02_38_14]PIW40809.1 MAG: hypothetical protein COW21_05180 [Candidatus Aenigmarchaeota archaeon CG15_BIG_FIL_POST_REV_8_21_14_020_37_27]PIX50998.1 MAG: hypothetical protein COZ52_01175 [Candidatus Aenigmarchaeota archaeon CG_4_8_14_3_um_filter_37_24]PIY35682.1 MAG: hypothetical protein COZ04_02600 [Candidatus Aenigmarchaeota archaeon CG_4_10_14_3_um_filter_37_21]PIZ36074.1 MAG: hypothetical protein COY38_00920 [Can
MKKIIFALAILVLSFQIVNACSNPILYNEFDVPISSYGSGYLTIDGDDYPSGSTKINYDLQVKNTNNQPLSFNLTPDASLASYVDQLTVELNPSETKSVRLSVYITSTKQGTLMITGQCQDGMPMPEGALGVKIYAAGDNTGGQTGSCKGNVLSCGIYPDCQDLTSMNGCYDGYYRNYFCTANTVQYSQSCTSTCCKNLLGPNGYCSGTVCRTSGNNPPVIDYYIPTNLNPTVQENGKIEFNQTSSDPEGDTLSYKWLLNGTEKSTSQNWTYVPGSDSKGVYNVTFSVTDGTYSVSKEWKLTVQQQTAADNGQSCAQNSECQSGYCVHSVCRSSSTYCGDNYCDSGEGCSSCSNDCGQCSSGSGSSGGGSGSSGGSGGGSFGGSGGSSSKSTGFYGFPAFVQAESGNETSIEGNFYSKYISDQTNVEFKILGIDNNWVKVTPSSLDKISYDEEVAIKITFNVPQGIKSDDYPFKISTKIGSINYDKTITLVVKAAQTPATIPTTTTLENQTNLEGQPEGKSPATGLFAGAVNFAKGFWYVALIPIVIVAGWKFSGISFVRQNGNYIETEDIPLDNSEEIERYVEVKQPEQKIEQPKPEKKKDQALEKAKLKVAEEMRKKAMSMDKR